MAQRIKIHWRRNEYNTIYRIKRADVESYGIYYYFWSNFTREKGIMMCVCTCGRIQDVYIIVFITRI